MHVLTLLKYYHRHWSGGRASRACKSLPSVRQTPNLRFAEEDSAPQPRTAKLQAFSPRIDTPTLYLESESESNHREGGGIQLENYG